ncbi:MAG: phosphate regulon transcriptional regulator PhoB [Burkholderiaceae bacterium]
MNERILIVEDEPAISELVAVNLRHAGYQISEAADARGAMVILDQHKPDLIVLDWMLPDMSGLDLAKRLRASDAYRRIAIIMLTARAQEGDKLQGFDIGVDDYMTKPFSPRELTARVKAVLRRNTGADSDSETGDTGPLELAGLRLERNTHRVFSGNEPVELSPTEFKLLAYFMSNPERVMSRGKLLDSVWGNSADIEERTVDVHIRRLRLALRPSGADQSIQTVRGGGYRFSAS